MTNTSLLLFSATEKDKSLLLYYDFNKLENGRTEDQSGNNRYGLTENVKLASGIGSPSLFFNGADSKVECANSDKLFLNKPGTMMFWIYPEYPIKGGVLSFGSSIKTKMVFRGDTNKKLLIILSNKTRRLNLYWGILALNIWQHIAVTFDGKEIVLYENGIPLQKITSNICPDTGDMQLTLGHSPVLSYYFRGRLDELKIYSRALSGKEIDQEYRRGAEELNISHKKGGNELSSSKSGDKELNLRMIEPFYRNNIYATEKIKNIKFKVFFDENISKKLSLDVSLKLNSKVLNSKKIKEVKNGQEISFPIDNLQTGNYCLLLEADVNGKKLKHKTEIKKLPLWPSEVRINDKLQVLVNGKPFVPVGWRWKHREKNGFFRHKELLNNINMVFHPLYYSTFSEIKNFLDVCEEYNLKAIISPYIMNTMMMRKLVKGSKKPPSSLILKQELKKLEDVVKMLNKHPALLAWYVADEPKAHRVKPYFLKRIYKTIRKADPFHPCIVANTHISGVKEFIDCADIMMPDKYLNFQTDGVPQMLPKKIFDILNAAKGKRPVWIITQAFNWTDLIGSQNNPRSRGPNYVEFRNNVFLAVTAHASGFVWVDAKRAYTTPAVRYGYSYLSKELQILRNAIVAPVASNEIQIRPDGIPISTVLKKTGNKFYYFAVNYSNTNQNVHFVFPNHKNTKLLVVSEGRITGTNTLGALSEHFLPNQTHIYTNDINPELLSLLSVDEIEGKIARKQRENIQQGNVLTGKPGVTLSLVVTNDKFTQQCLKKEESRTTNLMLKILTDNDTINVDSPKCLLTHNQWMQMIFASPEIVNRIEITTAPQQTIKKGVVEVLKGKEWVKVGAIENNSSKKISIKTDSISISGIKINVKEAGSAKGVLILGIGAFNDSKKVSIQGEGDTKL
ncbi:MAG: LamG domain-containing protein [Candidatus Theseobacter exili]|nr:LamG domain-containing protein [Candidatus Theseobacter exili]